MIGINWMNNKGDKTMVISPKYEQIKSFKIIKRDGREEPFYMEKLIKVLKWATESIKNGETFIENLLNEVVLKITDKMKIQDLYDALIEIAVSHISAITPSWDDVAKYLYLLKIYKEDFNLKRIGTYPPLQKFLNKGIEKGVYDKAIVDTFTEEELDDLSSYINPDRDLLFNYKGLCLFFSKYCKNSNDKFKSRKIELPQITYMVAAMQSHFNEPHSNKAEIKARLKNIMKCYDNLSTHKVTFSTPRLMFGLGNNPQFASCVLITPDDDTNSLNQTDAFAAVYSKNSGGIAIDVSYIRSSGSNISNHVGKSDGPIPFIKRYEQTVMSFNQMGVRSGAIIIYFPWWHMDSPDLIMLRDSGGAEEYRARRCKYSMKIHRLLLERTLKDEWITLFDPKETSILNELNGEEFNKKYIEFENNANIRSKKIKARELMELFFKVRVETGNLYAAFMDNINEQELTGRYVGMSNLCVSGDTKVLTKHGYRNIQDLVNQNVEVWNGTKWSLTRFEKTGEKQQLLNVFLSNGQMLSVTPYHKWYTVQFSKHRPINEIECRTNMLHIGTKLIKNNLCEPCIHGNKILDLAYENGFFTADGTEFQHYNQHICKLYFYSGKKKIKKYIRDYSKYYLNKNARRIEISYINNQNIKPKFFIPNIEYTIESRLEWFAGYLDGDGCVVKQKIHNKTYSIQMTSINKDFLESLSFFLHELGVDCKIRKNQDGRFQLLPNGYGGYKSYYCKTAFRLFINQKGVKKLINLGIKRYLHRLKINTKFIERHSARDHYPYVVKIQPRMGLFDTYCGNEPEKHKITFNGVITGNCCEINVPSRRPNLISEKYYKNQDNKYEIHTIRENGEIGLCNLSSINALNWFYMDDRDKNDLVMNLLRGMDNAIDSQFYPVAEAAWPNKSYRPIGIGITDFANLMAFEKIKYSDQKALQFTNDLLEDIYLRIYYQSMMLAKERGAYDGFKNSNWAKGLTPYHLSRFRKENILNIDFKNDKLWNELGNKIKQNGVRFSLHAAIPPSATSGKVTNATEACEPIMDLFYVETGTHILPTVVKGRGETRNYYERCWDIEPRRILELAAIRQIYLDQSQSFNQYYVRPDSITELFTDLMYAEKLGLKSIYYLKTPKLETDLECSSCSV